MTNEDKLDLIFDDLNQWLDGGETDCSMRYAAENGYRLHAVNLWLSTGALSEDIESKVQGVIIDRDKERKEIDDICNHAYIYVCPDCNHHAFLDDHEGESIDCISCNSTAILEQK